MSNISIKGEVEYQIFNNSTDHSGLCQLEAKFVDFICQTSFTLFLHTRLSPVYILGRCQKTKMSQQKNNPKVECNMYGGTPPEEKKILSGIGRKGGEPLSDFFGPFLRSFSSKLPGRGNSGDGRKKTFLFREVFPNWHLF